MESKEVIKELYEKWQFVENMSYSHGETMDYHFNESEKRKRFLSSAIIGISTYDDALDLEFGQMLYDTLVQIKNGTTFDYIKDEQNYRNYILSCNFISDWLDWGSSIRGAWFDIHEGAIRPNFPIENVEDYDKDYIKLDEYFIGWLIDFLES
ncbi:hypothetical protein WKH57_01070 [Niallia taxi]|uniref:hypothetical protein n=1 Tax=Niallia taxi TaxID=2499688 RepID=UPI003172E4D5